MKKMMITVNGKRYEVDVEIVQDDEANDYLPGSSRPVPRTIDSYVTPVNAPLPPKTKQTGADKKSLTSPVNGVILEVPVKEGQSVKENDVLFVLEAMKMKTNISSPQTGKIKSIKVKVSDKVEAGQVMLTFE
jgi:glutaconyl-CoA/methylmalonyl-CoA decarboxylase subunit gamma